MRDHEKYKYEEEKFDKYVEETIYNGSFPNAKDNVNLNKFNEVIII